jgi:ABC-type multidrug transport system fused ATPase/permease subunit
LESLQQGDPLSALIQIDRLSYSYPDGKIALRDINLSVEKGEKIGVVGQMVPENRPF